MSFLRRNDHQLHASILVAEWPPRPQVPDPDPLGVVYFGDADPVFKATEHLMVPLLTSPAGDRDYQIRVRQGSGIAEVSCATVPMVGNGSTVGVLGLIRYGDWEWQPSEVNALQTIAVLLTELQSRVTAEERLRYLASRGR